MRVFLKNIGRGKIHILTDAKNWRVFIKREVRMCSDSERRFQAFPL